MNTKSYLFVNFGGPRHIDEIEPFLCELLCDRDVVRTDMPKAIHNFMFRQIAKKRAEKVRPDYESIGGKSPIFFDTEWIASQLSEKLAASVFTFHRYIPETHENSLKKIESCSSDEIVVFPLFPQFTYATTGSIARFFSERLSPKAEKKLCWVQSYPAHPAFIKVIQTSLKEMLQKHTLKDEETYLLFSAHGLPQSFVNEGDVYEKECRLSFQTVMQAFPKIEGKLCFQSKFGPGEWLRPYTQDICEEFEKISTKKNVIFIPISFTSDHIETLFEVEKLYMPTLSKKGFNPLRLSAPGRRPDWLEAIETILKDFSAVSTETLIRK